MSDDFSFAEYDTEKLKKKVNTALLEKNIDTSNKPVEEKEKRKINFQDMPKDADKILNQQAVSELADYYMREESVPIPADSNQFSSYLSLVLSPNLKELELMIRGLEYVKRFNPVYKREEIILRKIPEHPLNEYGVNRIISELKVYCSPEIKLGRKRTKDYYNSVQHVCQSIVRLIYKNLKNFGMDSQVKQRNAKALCNAIIEFVDASYSRSIEGKENDLSRATEFKIEGNMDTINDPAKLFNKGQKEALKN